MGMGLGHKHGNVSEEMGINCMGMGGSEHLGLRKNPFSIISARQSRPRAADRVSR